jgi:pimeloyl-ACP methyl ester carboxylesterase
MLAPTAFAQIPSGDPTDLPVLSAQTPKGEGSIAPSEAPIAPVAKTIDGDISDWVGEISLYGGTAIYSGGEYVYQDHIFDAHGPDDGRDARRLAQTDPLVEHAPGLYRVDALAQADAAGELGVPVPEEYATNDTYGDAEDHVDGADIEEVRVALSDGGGTDLLVRTTTMTSPTTAVLVLADTQPGEQQRVIPFNSGISSVTADLAFFLTGTNGWVADLATGAVTALPAGSVATDAGGFTNAIEAHLPLTAMTRSPGRPSEMGASKRHVPSRPLSLAVASGTASSAGDSFAPLALEQYSESPAEHANLANVAFRYEEPVRIWFERDQALSLYSGTIDPFFTRIDDSKLTAGVSETYTPGHGYHDRIFLSESTPGVARESGINGLFQHYGLYLPAAYDGSTKLPLQWWLHWRGGSAHSGAAVVPKVFKQYGEDLDTIVVAPSGRGSSQWYVGTGHVDFLEVWEDVFETVQVDRDRVYVSGHSMGGFGTFLLTVLYPDRFAAGVPVSPPVTQGMWTGLDFPGCDDMTYDEYSPCYVQANGGNARAQHTRKLLANLRHVPLAIFAGVEDELVTYSGVLRQHEQLVNLGYRHRMYTNVAAEHYTPPAMDQWAEVADYEHRFVRPENPAHVTYVRDMPFEEATETSRSDGVPLNFDFDSAYWMSNLQPSTEHGTATFDGTSRAITTQQDPWAGTYRTIPDTSTPTSAGQAGPQVVTGLQWIDDPTIGEPEEVNGFTVDLKGAKTVRLDLGRMSIDTAEAIAATVSTTDPLTLELAGAWSSIPSIDGGPTATLTGDIFTIDVPVGLHTFTITPTSTVGAV